MPPKTYLKKNPVQRFFQATEIPKERLPLSTIRQIQKEAVQALYANNTQSRLFVEKKVLGPQGKVIVQLVPDPEDNVAGVSTFNDLDALFRNPEYDHALN